MTVAPWLQILQGLLTPVIGLTTLYIAWQQWKANKLKLVVDRYERRLRIYQEVVAVLTLVQRDFKPDFSDVQKFRGTALEVAFLLAPVWEPLLRQRSQRPMLIR